MLAAITSSTLSAESRTSGLALVNTATSLSRLVSSILFGLLWSFGNMDMAVWVFLIAMLIAIGMSALMFLGRTNDEAVA